MRCFHFDVSLITSMRSGSGVQSARETITRISRSVAHSFIFVMNNVKLSSSWSSVRCLSSLSVLETHASVPVNSLYDEMGVEWKRAKSLDDVVGASFESVSTIPATVVFSSIISSSNGFALVGLLAGTDVTLCLALRKLSMHVSHIQIIFNERAPKSSSLSPTQAAW